MLCCAAQVSHSVVAGKKTAAGAGYAPCQGGREALLCCQDKNPMVAKLQTDYLM